MKEHTWRSDATKPSERAVRHESERSGALDGKRDGRNASLVRKEDSKVTSAAVASTNSFVFITLTQHSFFVVEKRHCS